MKKSAMIIWTALVAVAVSSNALALDLTKLCGDAESLKGPDVRVYRGHFERDGASLEHVLAVVKVSDTGKASVFYVHGAQPAWRIKQADCSFRSGTYGGNTLTLRGKWTTVTYVFHENGKVSVERVLKLRSGGTRTTKGELMLVR